MPQIVNITINKTQLPDGRWLLYYDGSDIDLPCGVYYFQTTIGAVPYYSELFKVQSITNAIHPGLIMDKSHTALRFHDSKLKQDYYRTENLCDLGLVNPIDHIIPFVIDISELDGFDPGTIETKIICHDGKYEYDLSGEMHYALNTVLGIVYHDGRQLSGQLYCGVYYLQVKIGENYFYSEHFRVENITNVFIPNLFLYTENDTPTGFELITTDDGQLIDILI